MLKKIVERGEKTESAQLEKNKRHVILAREKSEDQFKAE